MKLGTIILICCLSLWFGHKVESKDDNVLHLPDATLLVGYGPTNLQITSSGRAFKLQPNANEPESWGHHILASLSRNGKLIGSARLKEGGRETIATFSLAEKKWVEYREVYYVWSVSISADGSKLAFVSEEKGGSPLLQVLDTKTGQTNVIVSTPVSVYAAASWAPDGELIAYQVDLPLRDPHIDHRDFAIKVVEVRTGKTWGVANGQNPSWSPSGEWIAYLDTSGNPGGGLKCMAVRPDGSGTKTLVTARGGFLRRTAPFVLAPVWSPDSAKMLLNEAENWEAWTMSIHLLDLTKHNLTRKLRNAVPVLGWAESK